MKDGQIGKRSRGREVCSQHRLMCVSEKRTRIESGMQREAATERRSRNRGRESHNESARY